MSKYWKSLGIDDHQAISDEVYGYVINHPDLLSSKKNYFFNQPVSYMLTRCPLLLEFLKKQQLTPVLLGIIVCNNQRELGMHRDNDGTYPWLRILWPIRNCQGSTTKIWKVPDGAGTITSDSMGTLFVEFLDNQERELIEEFELVSPVLFDSSSAHSVRPNAEIKEHRISLTIGFDRDLPISKSIKAWFGFQR